MTKGYALLFAVIVSAVVLSVAAFIVSVSRKQFILASTARDSLVAIYAADSGIQCAVEAYYKGTLATTSSSVTIPCNGADVVSAFNPVNFGDITGLGIGSSIYRDFYQTPAIKIGLPNHVCAAVTVTDGYYDDVKNGKPVHMTVIESRGYNIGGTASGESCPDNNPREIERAIRLVYRGG
ncbi:MAG: hypothetical protein QOG91_576 [Candidatus Parcubacteria bacterium]|nr:hypothetical protein [Candidatus Parcubacteria bacterium]